MAGWTSTSCFVRGRRRSTAGWPASSRHAGTTCPGGSGRRGCCATTPTRSEPCTPHTSPRAPGSRSRRATRRAGWRWAWQGSTSRRPTSCSYAAWSWPRKRATTLRGRRGLLVAASVGPYGAALADGSEYRGGYGLPHHELSVPRRAARGAGECRPDLFAVETIPDAFEAGAVVEALAAPPGHPGVARRSPAATDATTCGGDAFEDAVPSRLGAVRARGRRQLHRSRARRRPARRRASRHRPAVRGLPQRRSYVGRRVARTWSAGGTDVLADEAVLAWADAGAMLVGGCCGLGPAAVRAISSALA